MSKKPKPTPPEQAPAPQTPRPDPKIGPIGQLQDRVKIPEPET